MYTKFAQTTSLFYSFNIHFEYAVCFPEKMLLAFYFSRIDAYAKASQQENKIFEINATMNQ